MSIADLKQHMPPGFWLTHKSCVHILSLIVHRKNNEFTKKAMKESQVTTADQKKSKASATEKERQAVKERATAMAQAAVNPMKLEELKIQKKVAGEMVATSKQKRTEKKLDLLAKFKDQMSPTEFKRKVRKQLAKLEDSGDEVSDNDNDIESVED